MLAQPVDKPVDIHSISLSLMEKRLKFFSKTAGCRFQAHAFVIRTEKPALPVDKPLDIHRIQCG
jgi:hypothetical protein